MSTDLQQHQFAGRLFADPEKDAGEAPRARENRERGAGAIVASLRRLETRLARVENQVRSLRHDLGSPRFLTVADAAQLLHRSPHTIRRWLRDGTLEGTKAKDSDKGRWLIEKKEVEAFLERGHYHG